MTRYQATPDFKTEMRLRYSAVRSSVPDGIPTTVLHIGAEQTIVATGNGAEPGVMLVLAIGSRKTATDYFKHEPPAPDEMEKAIAAVENEVARARTILTNRSTLFTTDAPIHDIALIAGIPHGPELILTRDAMELTFERLAAVTLGRPASQEGIPTSSAFAATLLILREFMHHLQFTSITVKA
jgi:exopolyphosphatase/pppGpp-phosphohydrolase